MFGTVYSKDLRADEKHDLDNFEGNAQGFRVLTCSEFHPYDGGLRLTYATLGAFVKYPWTSMPAIVGERPKESKYGIYQFELSLFREVARELGLKAMSGRDWFCRHPLVHPMEIADDFCYALLDLENGLEMGILTWPQMFEVLRPVLDVDRLPVLEGELEKVGFGRRPPLIRGKVFESFVAAASSAFVEHQRELLSGMHNELFSLCSAPVVECVRAAKTLAQAKISVHPRRIELEIGS